MNKDICWLYVKTVTITGVIDSGLSFQILSIYLLIILKIKSAIREYQFKTFKCILHEVLNHKNVSLKSQHTNFILVIFHDLSYLLAWEGAWTLLAYCHFHLNMKRYDLAYITFLPFMVISTVVSNSLSELVSQSLRPSYSNSKHLLKLLFFYLNYLHLTWLIHLYEYNHV